MAQPIYKVWMAKYTPEWYKLTKDEQNAFMAKDDETIKLAGGEHVLACFSSWSSENWLAWGVDKYPDLDAVQKHAQLLLDLNHYLYIEASSYLGTELPQE